MVEDVLEQRLCLVNGVALRRVGQSHHHGRVSKRVPAGDALACPSPDLLLARPALPAIARELAAGGTVDIADLVDRTVGAGAIAAPASHPFSLLVHILPD